MALRETPDLKVGGSTPFGLKFLFFIRKFFILKITTIQASKSSSIFVYFWDNVFWYRKIYYNQFNHLSIKEIIDICLKELSKDKITFPSDSKFRLFRIDDSKSALLPYMIESEILISDLNSNEFILVKIPSNSSSNETKNQSYCQKDSIVQKSSLLKTSSFSHSCSNNIIFSNIESALGKSGDLRSSLLFSSLSPNFSDTFFQLLYANKCLNSLSKYIEELKLRPNLTTIYLEVLVHNGQYDDALSILQTNPINSTNISLHLKCLRLAGKLDEAIKIILQYRYIPSPSIIQEISEIFISKFLSTNNPSFLDELAELCFTQPSGLKQLARLCTDNIFNSYGSKSFLKVYNRFKQNIIDYPILIKNLFKYGAIFEALRIGYEAVIRTEFSDLDIVYSYLKCLVLNHELSTMSSIFAGFFARYNSISIAGHYFAEFIPYVSFPESVTWVHNHSRTPINIHTTSLSLTKMNGNYRKFGKIFSLIPYYLYSIDAILEYKTIRLAIAPFLRYYSLIFQEHPDYYKTVPEYSDYEAMNPAEQSYIQTKGIQSMFNPINSLNGTHMTTSYKNCVEKACLTLTQEPPITINNQHFLFSQNRQLIPKILNLLKNPLEMPFGVIGTKHIPDYFPDDSSPDTFSKFAQDVPGFVSMLDYNIPKELFESSYLNNSTYEVDRDIKAPLGEDEQEDWEMALLIDTMVKGVPKGRDIFPKIMCIGDQTVTYCGYYEVKKELNTFEILPSPILNLSIYDLRKGQTNGKKECFFDRCGALSESSKVIFCLGLIDCEDVIPKLIKKLKVNSLDEAAKKIISIYNEAIIEISSWFPWITVMIHPVIARNVGTAPIVWRFNQLLTKYITSKAKVLWINLGPESPLQVNIDKVWISPGEEYQDALSRSIKQQIPENS